MATIDLLSKSVNRRRFLALTGSAAAVGAVAATCQGAGEWEVPPGSGRKTWEAGKEAVAAQENAVATATAAAGMSDHSMPPASGEGRPKPSGDLAAVYDATLPPLDPNPVKDAPDRSAEQGDGGCRRYQAGRLDIRWLPAGQGRARDAGRHCRLHTAQLGNTAIRSTSTLPERRGTRTTSPSFPTRSSHFTWTADYPGVFMYHCGTGPVIQHIANGMYGAVVVDPARAVRSRREYVLVQSEFYLAQGDGGLWKSDLARAQAVAAGLRRLQRCREPVPAGNTEGCAGRTDPPARDECGPDVVLRLPRDRRDLRQGLPRRQSGEHDARHPDVDDPAGRRCDVRTDRSRRLASTRSSRTASPTPDWAPWD